MKKPKCPWKPPLRIRRLSGQYWDVGVDAKGNQVVVGEPLLVKIAVYMANKLFPSKQEYGWELKRKKMACKFKNGKRMKGK
jgi:hypothetical protein